MRARRTAQLTLCAVNGFWAGHINCMEFLLEEGADIEQRNVVWPAPSSHNQAGQSRHGLQKSKPASTKSQRLLCLPSVACCNLPCRSPGRS